LKHEKGGIVPNIYLSENEIELISESLDYTSDIGDTTIKSKDSIEYRAPYEILNRKLINANTFHKTKLKMKRECRAAKKSILKKGKTC